MHKYYPWKRLIMAIVLLIVSVLSGHISFAQEGVDPEHLPLGDGKVSTEPGVGYIWSCQTQFTGTGAFADGPWIRDDGTWDLTTKITIDGTVDWPNALFTMEVVGDERVFTSNGLPPHPTGIYPVQTSDDAYQYDRNPNSIQEQELSFTLPLNPTLADMPSCAPGIVGIMITGVPIFNGFDAEGRDAVAHEIQDLCGGHPERTGQYHYHNLSPCIEEMGDAEAHSELVGYIFDGFGIYGYHGEDGVLLTNADLDECHGHTHEIEWEGSTVSMYHYHATLEFPYTVGCFRGRALVRLEGGMGQGGQPPAGGGQPPAGGGQPPAGGQQPPRPGG